MKKILTIAGSDPSGGAGIQADLKTITVHKMYGMSVITALTAQNTTGVFGISEVSPEFVSLQLDCVFRDIRPDAVKIVCCPMRTSSVPSRTVCGNMKRKTSSSIPSWRPPAEANS